MAVALANLQGLGNVDLVTANPATNDVSVLLNQGDGVFSPAVNYPTGSGPTAIAVGDFTGHGNDDVVTADGSGISVLLGRGDGTLSPAVHYSVPTPVAAVVTGDFTGDGNQDIAVYGPGTGTAEPRSSPCCPATGRATSAYRTHGSPPTPGPRAVEAEAP